MEVDAVRLATCLFSAVFGLSLLSCDTLNDDASENDPLSVDVSYGGLAFSATGDWVSSSFYYYDFESGELKTLSEGEAGDSMPFYANDALYLFNRSATSQNFRTFDPSSSSQGAKQTSFPGMTGDPSDVFGLGGGELLLAEHISGELLIIDEAGEEVAKIEADWDLPEGAKIKPVKFLAHGEQILVLNQGYDENFAANGAQRLFVLEKSEGVWTAKDLDSEKEGVQGLVLTASCPDTFLDKGESSVVVMGTCSNFMLECTAGFDEIDLGAMTVTQLWDFTAEGYYMSGGSAGGDEKGKVYTAVSKVDGSEKRVVSVDYLSKSVEEVYSITGENVATVQLFNDRSSKTLIVSDAKDAETGMLVVFKDGVKLESQLTVEQHGISGGVLVPKEGEE